MKYKLIGTNDKNNIKETILTNRGVKDIKNYLNLTDKCLLNYSDLGDNLQIGLEMLKDAIKRNIMIYIIVDSDPDGYSSASMMYDFIYNKLEYKRVVYIMQTLKEHGLSRDVMTKLHDSETESGLVILPDAGTNDNQQCATLKMAGFKVLVLDHHQKEVDNNNAIIINNQTSSYSNKNLCGAGVVYKFIQAYDEEEWTDYADSYIDLVAFANISDVMDLRECETRHLVNKGLDNITHPLLQAIIKKQSYSISNTDIPTIIDISFYVTPLINAMIRLGKREEKEMMFKAFVKEYEEFDYKPRKSKNNPEPKMRKESIYERVARLCSNVKARQAKLQQKAVNEAINIYENDNEKNAICFVNATRIESLSKSITGLVAIKIASKYGKPCLVLRRDESKSTEEKVVFSGSGRNPNESFIEDLKQELNDSGFFIEAVGHPNAFGASIERNKIQDAIEYFNKKYLGKMNRLYKVDFEFKEEVDYQYIKQVNEMKDLFSSKIKEPMIYVSRVYVNMMGFEVFGKDKKHWKFQNGLVEYIKFNISENDKLWELFENGKDDIEIDIIGKTAINQYGSTVTPQVIIESYELVEE